MVKRIDDVGDILVHGAADIPRTAQQLFRLINQVGRQNIVEKPFAVAFVKNRKTLGKQAEGGKEENPGRAAVLESLRCFQDTVPGGNHTPP